MFIIRSTRTALRLSRNVYEANFRKYPVRVLCCEYIVSIKGFSTEEKDYRNMVDPRRVVSYDDMLKVINQPKKVIIDVRDPEEVESTGKIPSSINIPLDGMHDALVTMSNEDFRRNFQREKPAISDELIFYCRTGRRSSEALDKALKLGYNNSKTYLGSWSEWSSRRNL